MACVELKVCKHLCDCKPISSQCICKNSQATDTSQKQCRLFQRNVVHSQSEENGKHSTNKHCDDISEKAVALKSASLTEECLCLLEKVKLWLSEENVKVCRNMRQYNYKGNRVLLQHSGPQFVQHTTDFRPLVLGQKKYQIESQYSATVHFYKRSKYFSHSTFHRRHNSTSQRPVTDFFSITCVIKCDYYSTTINKSCSSQFQKLNMMKSFNHLVFSSL